MNDAFLTLPIEKQERIINAALEVFSKHEYKKANTEDIAMLAGISKGSLFYYFKNKESLYLYLYEYVTKLILEYIQEDDYLQITDFFELLNYGAIRKIALLEKNPYILDFTIQCFFVEETPITKSLNHNMPAFVQGTYQTYFSHIDTSKFKDGIELKDIYDILIYATEGYVYTLRQMHQKFEIDKVIDEFNKWKTLFKKMTYKEEFIDE